jgi:four helix bundle protein
VASAYQLIRKLPAAEMYGLSAQMRRAAVSIPSNIAEGHAGGRGARYRHHVRIALGSLAELDTHLEIAVRLGFLSPPERATAAAQLTRTRQLLHGLARSLEREKLDRGLPLLGRFELWGGGLLGRGELGFFDFRIEVFTWSLAPCDFVLPGIHVVVLAHICLHWIRTDSDAMFAIPRPNQVPDVRAPQVRPRTRTRIPHPRSRTPAAIQLY